MKIIEELKRHVLDKIGDEDQFKQEFYQGRVSAFKLVLDLIEELQESESD